MAGAAGADLLVARVGDMAAGIAGHHPADAAQILEDRFQAPEAAAAQGRSLGGRRLDRRAHATLPPRFARRRI